MRSISSRGFVELQVYYREKDRRQKREFWYMAQLAYEIYLLRRVQSYGDKSKLRDLKSFLIDFTYGSKVETPEVAEDEVEIQVERVPGELYAPPQTAQEQATSRSVWSMIGERYGTNQET